VGAGQRRGIRAALDFWKHRAAGEGTLREVVRLALGAGAAPGGLSVSGVTEVQAPPVSAAWLQRLGNFPFWRGETNLLDALEPVYEGASQRGLDTFLGGKKGSQSGK
jgi:hypothetical protein